MLTLGTDTHKSEQRSGPFNWIFQSGMQTYLVSLTALLVAWGWLILGPFERLSKVITDDAYYYFITAGNLFSTGMVTFDGFTETSGFHPLWMLMTAPVFGVMGETEAALRVATIMQVLLYGGTVALVVTTCRAVWSSRAAVAAGATLVLYPLFTNTWLSGIEGAVFSLALATVIHLLVARNYAAAVRDGSLSLRAGAVLGIAVGFAALARIEACFLMAVVFVWMLWPRSGGETDRRIKSAFAFALAGGAVVAPYFLWLWTQFGRIQPVSGLTKRIWAAQEWEAFLAASLARKSEMMAENLLFDNPFCDPARIAGMLGGRLAGVAGAGVASWVVLVTGIVIAVLYRDRWLSPLLQAGLTPFLIYAGVAYTYYATAMFHSHRDWYYCPEMLLSAIVIAAVYHGYHRNGGESATRGRPLFAAAMTLLVVAAIVGGVRIDRFGSPVERGHITARLIEQHTEPDDITGLFDAGVVAFYTDRTITNIDGLINGTELYELQGQHRVVDWLLEHEIGFVFDGARDRATLREKLDRFDSIDRWERFTQIEAVGATGTLLRVTPDGSVPDEF